MDGGALLPHIFEKAADGLVMLPTGSAQVIGVQTAEVKTQPLVRTRVIPLGQVATITRAEGPNEIASENDQLRACVQANVSGRDLGGFVEDVKSRLQNTLAPQLAAQGMTLDYSGEYEHQFRAARTLPLIDRYQATSLRGPLARDPESGDPWS